MQPKIVLLLLFGAGLLLRAVGQGQPASAYEDDRIRVALPAGWSANPTTVTATGDRTFL